MRPRPAHRGRLRGFTPGRGEPREPAGHRLEHTARQAAIAERIRSGGQNLGDEERVPVGKPIQRLGVNPAAGGQRATPAALSGSSPIRVTIARRRHITQQQRQRVLRADLVVAVGHH